MTRSGFGLAWTCGGPFGSGSSVDSAPWRRLQRPSRPLGKPGSLTHNRHRQTECKRGALRLSDESTNPIGSSRQWSPWRPPTDISTAREIGLIQQIYEACEGCTLAADAVARAADGKRPRSILEKNYSRSAQAWRIQQRKKLFERPISCCSRTTGSPARSARNCRHRHGAEYPRNPFRGDPRGPDSLENKA